MIRWRCNLKTCPLHLTTASARNMTGHLLSAHPFNMRCKYHRKIFTAARVCAWMYVCVCVWERECVWVKEIILEREYAWVCVRMRNRKPESETEGEKRLERSKCEESEGGEQRMQKRGKHKVYRLGNCQWKNDEDEYQLGKEKRRCL